MAPEDPIGSPGPLWFSVPLVVIPEGDLLLPLSVFAAGQLCHPAPSGETLYLPLLFLQTKRRNRL
jgi:hypothetical protein